MWRKLCAFLTRRWQIYTESPSARWISAIRRGFSGLPAPPHASIRRGFGYHLLDGDSCYLFFRQGKALHLTPLTVYSDQTIRIGAAGDRFYTLEEIKAFFTNKILTTTPREEEWVILEGLGEVLLAPAVYGTLPAWKKQKEIADTIFRLAGEEDSLDRFMKAHYQYLTAPSDWAREALRKAYEAVPEHQRMFLGDMDTRDSDFIPHSLPSGRKAGGIWGRKPLTGGALCSATEGEDYLPAPVPLTPTPKRVH